MALLRLKLEEHCAISTFPIEELVHGFILRILQIAASAHPSGYVGETEPLANLRQQEVVLLPSVSS